MESLTAAILLRMTGLDALDVDSEAQPPHGELAQSEQRVGTGEGHAVVGGWIALLGGALIATVKALGG